MINRVGSKRVFRTNSAHIQLNKFNGSVCKIIKVYSKPDKTHDKEVLPMYEIKFFDGIIKEAFKDELYKTKRVI
jgi:hypothetical protein